jgi:hypothetical protein
MKLPEIKEPRTFFAFLLLIHITVTMLSTLNNMPPQAKITPLHITGLTSTGTVSVSIIPRQSLELKQGYNLISFFRNIENRNVSDALSSIGGKYYFVLRWNRTGQRFDSFSPDATNNEFDVLELNESYFISMKEDATLLLTGNEINDTNVSLMDEFNSPSYPYNFTAEVSKYVAPINESVLFVLKWNVTSQEFILYSPESLINDFETIQKGEGQFIYLTQENVTLRYNKTLLQS